MPIMGVRGYEQSMEGLVNLHDCQGLSQGTHKNKLFNKFLVEAGKTELAQKPYNYLKSRNISDY